ncbi:uncharacterized protein K452DRAFT_273368 [Aplosporella prunicola CBS 121167]|uniref:Polyketide synthase-like methyltransferase domain-containing protein n=1 Tax=Aplosporella prunicola CBS 121167 TaxID=1176127 RepID=A0A6A6BBK7_9PEZI|nr:uncharacterized protein K452DRAFT_273368 [Aplosporella prunicola CBS 121167]KAF2140654.1 hypothetical protein K452DRAFT_273368 [Aplosporella prunicola CBS 121167]
MSLLSDIATRTLVSFAQSTILSVLQKITYGRLHIILKESQGSRAWTFGQEPGNKDDPEVTLTVLDDSIWMRLCLNLDVGFAEAYMLRQIEISNLQDLFVLYIHNWDAISNGSYLAQTIPKLLRLVIQSTNDPANALRNASFHYDASNELFCAFLSPDMNYSCAIWDPANHTESLEAAQQRKVHNIISNARIEPTHHVLDIGCGWGHLAIEAVKRTGCRVTGITLSKEQKALAEKRIAAAGLQDKIKILICDYRDVPIVPGGYDRVVSVEMIEHVGRAHMSSFFSCISELLNPTTGIMVVQSITIMNKIYDSRGGDNFLDVYIFPGGDLPCVSVLSEAINTGSKRTLEVETIQSIGPHYAKTLRSWRENFEINWERIRKQYLENHPGTDEQQVEPYRRRWIYYFTYCEAGFRTNILGDHVITAVRRPQPIPADVPL